MSSQAIWLLASEGPLITAREIALALCGFVVALGAAVGVIHRWVVKPMDDRDRRVAREEAEAIITPLLAPVNAKLDAITEDLRGVVHEVNYNSGASLKDMVRTTGTSLIVLSKRFDDHLRFHQPQLPMKDDDHDRDT